MGRCQRMQHLRSGNVTKKSDNEHFDSFAKLAVVLPRFNPMCDERAGHAVMKLFDMFSDAFVSNMYKEHGRYALMYLSCQKLDTKLG
eukprot:6178895-Pleurochrysis_carterae.AAC.4